MAYVAATWGEPNRNAILGLVVAGLFSALLVDNAPADRIVRGRWREPFFVGWAVAEAVLIAMIVAADGGTGSPTAFLLILPLLFGTLSYPLPATLAIGAFTVIAFLTVAATAGDDPVFGAFGAFALLCAALMSAWESHNQAGRRQSLVDAAGALGRSESMSRRQARQQEEVARLGAQALEGGEIETLFEQALNAVRSGIDMDVAALLRLDGQRQILVPVALAGLPGREREPIPLGVATQPAYTIATGAPVIVEDWSKEERFEQAESFADRDLASGLTVPIGAGKDAYGVLSAQSVRRRKFAGEDLNFLQALANVLGSAIERRAEQERNRHDAMHDPLTGLANRTLFLDRLGHALSLARRHGNSVAVLFLDLDEFKLVNDSLGHAAGDKLLSAIAPRLGYAIRDSDTVARFGGDEFAILMEEVEDAAQAMRLAERIARDFKLPFDLDQEHFISASIGIAVADGSEHAETVLRDADAALYEAKRRGRGSYQLFGAATRERVIAHLELETGLRRAVEREEFELHYQPVLKISDRSLVGFEALVRWRHPQRGLLMPDVFIPIAEAARLIGPIGRWVVEQACAQVAEWQAQEPDAVPLGIGVNLSAAQLVDQSLPEVIAAAVTAAGIDPASLRLELTETILVEDWDTAQGALAELKRLGVRLVLDDFGSGFSSLRYLSRLDLDTVKLDRGFIENLKSGSGDDAIVSAVTGLGATLGFTVVAEGIETIEQLQIVESLGCGYAQGYYFARPLAAAGVRAMLARTRAGECLPLAPTAAELASDPRLDATASGGTAGGTADPAADEVAGPEG